ncbi:MAG: sensor histidine kinase [Thermoleophilaceae bacterium]|nr:sensor histidine kinase [Thermoleophilaceae bacterium]
MARRASIGSIPPVLVFAGARVALSVAGLIAVVATQYDGWENTALVIGGLVVPWSLGVLLVATRNEPAALGPVVMAGDLLVLLAVELVTPDASRGVRSAATFLVAAHAHFQGPRRGVILAVVWVAVLVAGSAIRGGSSLDSHVVAFHDTLFALATISTGLVVGRLRTAETASRLLARDLSRHTMREEAEVRRRVAQSIHDGPVQDLIGLDMILSTLGRELEAGTVDGRARDLLGDARELTTRNVQALRDEMVDLGPYGFREVTLASAIEGSVPAWSRRYGVDVKLDLENDVLPEQVAGELFRISQEAVINAGRHADASTVTVTLRRQTGGVELTVADDGSGFEQRGPRPGHLGLAGMRERAELLGGRLDIASSPRGTVVTARVPLAG